MNNQNNDLRYLSILGGVFAIIGFFAPWFYFPFSNDSSLGSLPFGGYELLDIIIEDGASGMPIEAITIGGTLLCSIFILVSSIYFKAKSRRGYELNTYPTVIWGISSVFGFLSILYIFYNVTTSDDRTTSWGLWMIIIGYSLNFFGYKAHLKNKAPLVEEEQGFIIP